ncbi:unnamed protein product [Strongylus vulgaris]|uniref:WW domain-containing protein n=1 Tax=Strongylus vulgaris TaxID=40348 RepID=A0A3P7JBV2_STRVU|nr:unnamed protein product [Strongylus vulgaris]
MNLPEGWTRITHNSGMPVYLHRKSRVVSLSKPYFIGTQGVRDHPIPVTGIPCLHQRRIMERDAALAAEAERQKKNESEASETTLENEIKQKLIAPAVKIEVCKKRESGHIELAFEKNASPISDEHSVIAFTILYVSYLSIFNFSMLLVLSETGESAIMDTFCLSRIGSMSKQYLFFVGGGVVV